MIGSRDSNVEFSRKRPGTDDSPRVRADGGCVGKSSLRRTGQCVVKKSDDANPCRSHASAPLTNWWGPRTHYLRDRRTAWWHACMDGVQHHACMRVEKKSVRRTGAVEYRMYTRAIETIPAGVHETSGWRSQVGGGRGLSPRDLHHPPTNLG